MDVLGRDFRSIRERAGLILGEEMGYNYFRELL
jgi:hypothetical protein